MGRSDFPFTRSDAAERIQRPSCDCLHNHEDTRPRGLVDRARIRAERRSCSRQYDFGRERRRCPTPRFLRRRTRAEDLLPNRRHQAHPGGADREARRSVPGPARQPHRLRSEGPDRRPRRTMPDGGLLRLYQVLRLSHLPRKLGRVYTPVALQATAHGPCRQKREDHTGQAGVVDYSRVE